MAKKIRARVSVLCVGVFLVLLAASVPAEAAKKPITGKLSKPGYTVIALGANGKAAAVRAKPRFKVKPKAKRVTLHLRDKSGTYAGPIVIAKKKKGKRAILGVKAGAKLGKVKVKARKGYAKLKKNLAKKFVVGSRKARAKKGVPIGAGKFGRVRSKNTQGGGPGDLDLDGIPDPLDIDDDGDKVIDDNDRSTVARASQSDPSCPSCDDSFHAFTRLTLTMDRTVNANAAALTDAQINAAVSSSSDLLITILAGATAELDCGDPDTGLVYCRKNGSTGQIFQPGVPGGNPFPACCDLDGDGFGTLIGGPPAPGAPQGGMTLHHGATTDQIGTGDVMIQRVSDASGVETGAFPSTQAYVFATVPALVSYDDGQGNSATVAYPVAAPDPGTGMGGGPGTRENPIPVAAGPSGDVVLTQTFWRPQRRPIPPETGDWIDIGGLVLGPSVADIGGRCPQSTLSESDPNLAPVPILPLAPGVSGFLDQASDQPANPANTFTYTVNLTQCLAAYGLTFNPGEKQGVEVQGLTPTFGGIAIQQTFFERQ
jgi:hypothetical protein